MPQAGGPHEAVPVYCVSLMGTRRGTGRAPLHNPRTRRRAVGVTGAQNSGPGPTHPSIAPPPRPRRPRRTPLHGSASPASPASPRAVGSQRSATGPPRGLPRVSAGLTGRLRGRGCVARRPGTSRWPAESSALAARRPPTRRRRPAPAAVHSHTHQQAFITATALSVVSPPQPCNFPWASTWPRPTPIRRRCTAATSGCSMASRRSRAGASTW